MCRCAACSPTNAYDGLGHRLKVTSVDGSSRIQLYTPAGQLLYAVQPGGSTPGITRYIYLHQHLLAEVGPGGTLYEHTDGLGSPVVRTNAARGVVGTTRYEPCGATASGVTPSIGFTGHVNDADTGLVYMQQRYYDPIAGRFLSIDPVSTDANTGKSFNRYVYANNNPYKYIDPDGRNPADLSSEPYQAPHAEVVSMLRSVFGNVGREGVSATTSVSSKTTLTLGVWTRVIMYPSVAGRSSKPETFCVHCSSTLIGDATRLNFARYVSARLGLNRRRSIIDR